MSDDITDAKRECKPIKYILPNSPPTRCKGCVFITCSPPDAQWECMNPIDTELLDKDNTCIYHLTAGELAEYCRRRLMAKLKGGSKVQEDKVNRPPCKWLRKNRDYANQWYCASPALKSRMKLKDIDHCLGCSIYEPQVVNDMSKDTELQCKHLLDNSHCANMDGSECPFVSMWNKWVIARHMCKHYEFNIRYEVHVLGNSTSIIGAFKTREQAEQFIRDNVKVVEMIP